MHTDKLTTKSHLYAYLYGMHCGLMCGVWDWRSTIVEDLNNSQDPKHMLFCCEKAFVAIYPLFSDNECPPFAYLGGEVPKRGQCHLFYRFLYRRASLSPFRDKSAKM